MHELGQSGHSLGQRRATDTKARPGQPRRGGLHGDGWRRAGRCRSCPRIGWAPILARVMDEKKNKKHADDGETLRISPCLFPFPLVLNPLPPCLPPRSTHLGHIHLLHTAPLTVSPTMGPGSPWSPPTTLPRHMEPEHGLKCGRPLGRW